VAGVLPDLAGLLKSYKPATMETPHIDQIFLRDRVWPLVHDRCFAPPGAVAWGLPEAVGSTYVGHDEYAARRDAQPERLDTWLKRLPSLRLA